MSRRIQDVIRETFRQWKAEDLTRMAAALAYFAAFSVIPLLLLAAALATWLFGAEEVEWQVVGSLREFLGQEVAETARELLRDFYANNQATLMTTVFSGVALLIGASGVFRHLKNALNVIWNIQPAAENKVRGFVQDTLQSLVTVAGVGMVLFLLFAANAGAFAALRSLDQFLSDAERLHLWQALGMALLFGTTVFLFASIYRFLPDARIKWRDAVVGATVSAILFMLGQVVLAFFLSQSAMDSLYGAATAFMMILIWVYFSAHIVLLGAEFTQVYANRVGSKIEPTPEHEPRASPSPVLGSGK